jgi:hypothetical protein
LCRLSPQTTAGHPAQGADNSNKRSVPGGSAARSTLPF